MSPLGRDFSEKELEQVVDEKPLTFSQLSDNVAKVAQALNPLLSANARYKVLQEQSFINFSADKDNVPNAHIDNGVAIFITDLEFFAEINFYADGRISLMKYEHGSSSKSSEVLYSDLSELNLRDVAKETKRVLYP